MSTGSVVRELTERLGSASEARWLAEEVAARSPVAPDGAWGPDRRRLLDDLVARRLSGEPLQYVLGSWAFRSLDLTVDRRALIPRPETEQVTEVARAELGAVVGPRADPVVVDLGTGSGAIALSLAVEEAPARPGIAVWATDRHPQALALAEVNRVRVADKYPAVERIRLRQGDWFSALPRQIAGAIDLVVANPPYVDPSEWPDLPPELGYEPRGALLAGPGSDGTPGFSAIEAILRAAPGWLAEPGVLVVELAPHQEGPAVAGARSLGFDQVRVAPDLARRPRALVARLG